MLETLSRHRCFGGEVGFYRHDAGTTACAMRFAVFTPPQAQNERVPVLYYLAGLTCTEETFMIKAGAQRLDTEIDQVRGAEQLRRLARFGFPFVVCVREHDKASILATAEARLQNDPETELRTALGEIAKIARLRLNDLEDGA